MSKKLGRGMDSLLSNKMLEKAKESFHADGLLGKQNEKKEESFVIEDKAIKREQPSDQPFTISLEQIKTNPNQPRKIFKEKELEELALSIKENGIIQPLIVVKSDTGFELVAGERRLRAAKRAGLTAVPVIIKRGTERDKMVMSIIENVQRSDLNCVEEALAYYQLMNEFKLTQEDVAKRVGKERSTVANFLRVLNLPREVVEFLQKEQLSFGHAKVLASFKEREEVIRLARTAVENEWSVRELEKSSKKKVTFQKEKKESDPEYSKKIDDLKKMLEQKTGMHFDIKSKPNGPGQVIIKFNNEAEFNDIYDYILKRV